MLLENRHTLSPRLKAAIVQSRLTIPQYRLAGRAGLDPTKLSSLLHDATTVMYGDPRVVRLGAELGFAPDECFVAESESSQLTPVA